jgi:hypothetical protein
VVVRLQEEEINMIFNFLKKSIMRKIFVPIFCLIAFQIINAQYISDGLRYSSGETQGTARFKAMGGAFGALGGDISAISINPAGAAIFNKSHGSLSASNNSISKDAFFGGRTTNRTKNNFDLHQLGAAFVFKNNNTNSLWNKFVVSLFYEQLQDYNARFFANGTTTNSISSYFLQNANGLKLGDIRLLNGETPTQAYGDIGAVFGYQHQQAFLGYEGGILEPGNDNDDDNIIYTSNTAAGDFYQEYDYQSRGYNGKFSANIAFQYNQSISLGLNLNSHFIDFEKSTYLFEKNSNTDSTVNEVNFENKLYTTGEGFSLQLGTIVKLTDKLRVGFSYDTPTWLTLREETTQYLSTFGNANNQSYVVNPNIVNIFPEYNLKTPGKVTGSIAYVLGKTGIISFDYARKNYANMSFDTGDNQLDTALSNDIKNTFKVANTYKLGAELRHKNISFRGGYRLEESPYKNAKIAGDLNGFSIGIGYNFGFSRLDLAYENTEQKRQQQLYESGTLDTASINNKNSIISLTLSMDL